MSRHLVKEILTDITNRIAVEEGKNKGQDIPTVLQKKKVCVLFAGYGEPLDQILLELKKMKRYGYEFILVLSKEVEGGMGIEFFQKSIYPQRIITEKDQEHFKTLMEEMDMLLIPSPTQNLAAKLKQGIQDSIESILLWRALWDGKPVWADVQRIRLLHGKQSKNPILERIVESHIDFLKESGIRSIGEQNFTKEIIAFFSDNAKSDMEASTEIRECQGKQVITEKDILDVVGKADQINISKGSIITPLAQDTAKAKKIKLVRT